MTGTDKFRFDPVFLINQDPKKRFSAKTAKIQLSFFDVGKLLNFRKFTTPATVIGSGCNFTPI